MDNNLNMGIIRVELNRINKGCRRVLKDTQAYCADVLSYLVHVVCDHKDEVFSIADSKSRMFYVEYLVHATASNPDPEYKTFDVLFYKFPSYIRRACIHAAVGHVQSHETRCSQYYEKRDTLVSRGIHYREMEPSFTYTPDRFPTMYRGQSVKFDPAFTKIQIKVRIRNTWDWITVSMPERDRKRLAAAAVSGTVKNPTLVYEYGKYYLHFPVRYKCASFPKTKLAGQAVLGVDLGLNNGAVCSVVDASGTVHGRYFSPFKKDMDLITHIINRIRKYARKSGRGQSLAKLYTKLRGLKENYVRQLARWIVNRAAENNVYGIVLEHLSRMKGRGSLAARTHHWCTAKIRDYIRGMAFRAGIRVFIINPKNTSAIAYDGSGKVVRDNGNYSMCTFSTGKRYNCDLSASYNIAARYFLRAYFKSIPATEWSELAAKVPGLSKRTSWTLSTLRSLREYIA